MKTFSAKKEEVERQWLLIDLEGRTLGRAATEIATILRGKNKPIYTPHVDTGDYVVCINAEKVVLTGNKLDQKKYYRHSGFVGGIKEQTARNALARRPEFLIQAAVKGMLPKNTLGRQMFDKLRVYAGGEHPHSGQTPKVHDF